MERQGLQATAEQAERLHHFAHDLRNRLAGMQQILRMLGAPDPGMDATELVEFAEQQYFKAMHLTEELLNDLAVERGTGPLATTSVDLVAAVRSAVELLDHRFSKKEQRVELMGSAPCMAMAEPKHLDQLLSALLSNASKFSPAGSVIRIVLGRDGDRVLADITDVGVGLDAKDLALVFQRYAMLGSRSTAGEEQGRSTLSRAKQWAQAMGGDLSAKSPGSGAGCTFRVVLSLA